MQLFNLGGSTAPVADPECSAGLETRTPAGRRGNFDELAGGCILLSSDAASYVNGHTLFVDGAVTASL